MKIVTIVGATPSNELLEMEAGGIKCLFW